MGRNLPVSAPDPEALADVVIDVLRPLVERIKALESRVGVLDSTSVVLRERCAVLETRAPVPGPTGPPGFNGIDGAAGINGKDGADGLGFGDLAVSYDGDRTFTFTATRDEQTKMLGAFELPIPIDRGVWHAGMPYARGDLVSYGGSGWIARKESQGQQPGTNDGADAWRLMVKRGDRGRDLRLVEPVAR